MAVTSALRREAGDRKATPVLQKIKEEEQEGGEVKRIKVNPSVDAKKQMDNIVDEEWKRISLGIEKQASSVHLKRSEETSAKVGMVDSELRRTIINKPAAESKRSVVGVVSDSRIEDEPLQKTIVVSEAVKPNQAPKKSGDKRRRWDDGEESSKSRKYDDDKKSHKKKSPAYKVVKSPPKSYRSSAPFAGVASARNAFSFREEKAKKDSLASKDPGRKSSKDVIVIDDEIPKLAAAKAVEKSVLGKPGSSAPVTTTAAVSSAPSSFKFSWMTRPAKSTLLKPGAVQKGPMPGWIPADKGRATAFVQVCEFGDLFSPLIWEINTPFTVRHLLPGVQAPSFSVSAPWVAKPQKLANSLTQTILYKTLMSKFALPAL